MGLIMGNLSDSSRWSMHDREAKSVMMPNTASSTAESYSYSYTDAVAEDPEGTLAQKAGKIAAGRYAEMLEKRRGMLEKRRGRIMTATGVTILALSTLLLSTCGSNERVINDAGTTCYHEGNPDGTPTIGRNGVPTCEED